MTVGGEEVEAEVPSQSELLGSSEMDCAIAALAKSARMEMNFMMFVF
jgi:hypothetical protein